MRFCFILISFFLPWTASAFDHSHSKWTQVLKAYQNEQGFVRYAKLKAEGMAEGQAFAVYLKDLQAVTRAEFNGWTDAQKKAFLINAYNALTIKLIVDHYPIKSIKKIGGFFSKPWAIEFFSLLGGEIKALDPIEHEWLRPKFKDYRIHAAVNCASYSCPPLRNEAFVADKLDAQLDGQMRAWLADPTRNHVTKTKLQISKIFDWYKKDFEEWGGGVKPVVSKYASAPLNGQDLSGAEVKYLDYNWDLNEAK